MLRVLSNLCKVAEFFKMCEGVKGLTYFAEIVGEKTSSISIDLVK